MYLYDDRDEAKATLTGKPVESVPQGAPVGEDWVVQSVTNDGVEVQVSITRNSNQRRTLYRKAGEPFDPENTEP